MNPRLTPTIFVQSGFERMLVFPGISKADFLGDAENLTFYRLNFKMNPRLTPTIFVQTNLKEFVFPKDFKSGYLRRCWKSHDLSEPTLWSINDFRAIGVWKNACFPGDFKNPTFYRAQLEYES